MGLLPLAGGSKRGPPDSLQARLLGVWLSFSLSRLCSVCWGLGDVGFGVYVGSFWNEGLPFGM